MKDERVVVMQRDGLGSETPASQPLTQEGAAWEMMRLARTNPDAIYWVQPMTVRQAS